MSGRRTLRPGFLLAGILVFALAVWVLEEGGGIRFRFPPAPPSTDHPPEEVPALPENGKDTTDVEESGPVDVEASTETIRSIPLEILVVDGDTAQLLPQAKVTAEPTVRPGADAELEIGVEPPPGYALERPPPWKLTVPVTSCVTLER